MRYIAIILTSDVCIDYEYSTNIVTSITDWQKVSDEEYKLLQQASYNSGRGYGKNKVPYFQILERPENEKMFIEQTIEAYKKFAQEEAEREEKEKQKRKEQYEKKKLESAAKKKEKLLKQLAALEEDG